MNYVFIRYSFLFNPTSTWQHLSQFENDLADFFAANGLEVEIVKGITGQVGERMLLIKRIENRVVPTEKKQGRPLSIPGTFNKLRNV